tara:strand:- start:1102 stop:1569 length:468 start_codon:yes stop_codon:yes gene_type:complete
MTVNNDTKVNDNLILSNNVDWKNQNIVCGYSGYNLPAWQWHTLKTLYISHANDTVWNSGHIIIYFSVVRNNFGIPTGTGKAFKTIYWLGNGSQYYGFNERFSKVDFNGSVSSTGMWFAMHWFGSNQFNISFMNRDGDVSHFSAEIHVQLSSAHIT